MSTVLTPPQPAAVTPPPAGTLPAGPQPVRWTIAQYQRLASAGLLDGLRTMLIHGQILVMPTPDPPHVIALRLTDRWLSSVCPPAYHVRNQAGFDVGTRNDPEPDLAVVPGDIRDYSAAHPRAAVLVVEVADSSLAIDTTEKAEVYATAGVLDYWVLDLVNRTLIIFRDPHPLPAGLGATAYRTRTEHGPADTVSPLAAPTAIIKVADLLP
jgi:Uma2 family endonuclease